MSARFSRITLNFRAFGEIIIRKHQPSKTQLKLDAFFKPVSRPKPASPQQMVPVSPGLTSMEEERCDSSSAQNT
jgi:hypothetical protein